MTKLLDDALEVVRALPAEQQDELARVLMRLTGQETEPYVLSPEDEADLDASEAAAARGDFATDGQVQAIWAKHGL